MISFSKLGNYGRLGNQLFQYAFLRLTAQRLNTNFYCPKWDGDDIFDLQDEDERASSPSNIIHTYPTGFINAGFTPEALSIADHTDMEGFFQSEKYYPDKQLVRQWYTFKHTIVEEVEELYGNILKCDCVSLSLRLDSDYANTREYFPLSPLTYYKKSLAVAKPKKFVLVFADRPDLAEKFLQPINDREFIFINNLNGPQQLYLMTRCRVNVITNSTFAWWGAWLNNHPEKMIISPASWCRPGVPNPVDDILCDDWIKIPCTLPIFDHFSVWRLRHPVATCNRIMNRVTKKTVW